MKGERSPLLSVAGALARILASAPQPLAREEVPLEAALGRTLAEDLAAKRTQPPFAASAMDGYAVRADDLEKLPARLRVVGMSAAGHGFGGRIGPGEAVRIFTGAPLPEGADTVVLQEDADAEGEAVLVREGGPRGRHVRSAGLDFAEGDALLRQGTRLGARTLALAAAMGHARVPVVRKPRVAVLATGDELVRPAETPGPYQIVASNGFALAALVERSGGETIDLGIAGDSFDALEAGIAAARAAQAEVLLTLGGASVGDHDLVQSALKRQGMELGFWKIAMRPGKPLMHGRLGGMRILGLPGNPVSSIVCGLLFVRPLVRALLGDTSAGADPSEPALLGVDVKANDSRQDYVRARLEVRPDGLPLVSPLPQQDSSMLRLLAEADCLLIREPHAPAAPAGSACRVIRFDRRGM
jgi:molybdopterin molybdotransferase